MYLRTRRILLVPQLLTLLLVYQASIFIILSNTVVNATSGVPETTLSRCNSSGYGPCAVICRQDLLAVSHCEFEFIKSLSNSGAPLRVGAQVSRGSCWGLTRLARPALRTPGVGRRVGETPPSLCAAYYYFLLFWVFVPMWPYG